MGKHMVCSAQYDIQKVGEAWDGELVVWWDGKWVVWWDGELVLEPGNR